MNKTEFKVPIPKGMEIDEEKSTFQLIKFKPIKPKRWRDDHNAHIKGYLIASDSRLMPYESEGFAPLRNVFATKKQAISALAAAYISQIMANDERFGGVVTDEEWNNNSIDKYVVKRINDSIQVDCYYSTYHFLAFHTRKQRSLFLLENRDLVKDYLMIE